MFYRGRGGRGGRRGGRGGGPRLPTGLMAQVGGGGGSRGYSRKEQRKSQRNDKKQGKASHYHSTRTRTGDASDESDDEMAAFAAGKSRPSMGSHQHGSTSSQASGKSAGKHTSSSIASAKPVNLVNKAGTKRGRESDSNSGSGARKFARVGGDRKAATAARERDDSGSEYDDDDDSELSDIEDDTPDGLAAGADGGSLDMRLLDPSFAASAEEDEALIRRLEKKLGLKTAAGGAAAGRKSAAAAADDNEDAVSDEENGNGGGGGGKKKSANEANRARALRKLNKEFAGDGLGEDFGSFLSDLDRIIYDSGSSGGKKSSASSTAGKRPQPEQDQDDGDEDEGDEDEDDDDDDDEEEEEEVPELEEMSDEEDAEDDEDHSGADEDEEGEGSDSEDGDDDGDSDSSDGALPDEYTPSSSHSGKAAGSKHADMMDDEEEAEAEEEEDEAADEDDDEDDEDEDPRSRGGAMSMAELIKEANRFTAAAKYRRKLLQRIDKTGEVLPPPVAYVSGPAITRRGSTASASSKSSVKKGLGLNRTRRISFSTDTKIGPTLQQGGSDDSDEDEEDGDEEEEDAEDDEDEEDAEDDEDDEDEDEEGDEDEEEDDEGDDDEDDEGDEEEEAASLPAAAAKPSSVPAPADAASATGGKYIPPALRRLQQQGGGGAQAVASSTASVTASASSAASTAPTVDRRAAFDRGAPDPQSPSMQALARSMKGLLNKLGDTNLEPISQEVAAMYRSHPTAECNAALVRLICEASDSHVQTLRSLVMLFAALIAALHITVGPGVGAYAAEKIVLRFADACKLPLQANPSAAEVNESSSGSGSALPPSSKLRNNLLLLLCYLYIFQVINSTLLVHCLMLLCVQWQESSVELLLLALMHTGFQLRTDDPAALKDILQAVHTNMKKDGSVDLGALAASSTGDNSKSSSSSGSGSAVLAGASLMDAAEGGATAIPMSTRLRFLGEMLLDLRNNRKRSEHEQVMERGQQLRKWLSRLASRTTGLEGVDRRLRLSWPDIMNIPEVGRWWLVGSSWAGHAAAGMSSKAAAPGSMSGKGGTGGSGGASAGSGAATGLFTSYIASRGASRSGSGAVLGGSAGAAVAEELSLGSGGFGAEGGGGSSKDAQLLAMARSMRMNTPGRRAVFVALMGAEDVDDALERVLKIGLKGAAERDIVRVLMDCAGQEAAYNDYYARVGNRLCQLHSRFRFTFQLAYWDMFKTLDDASVTTPRRVYNVARLAASLLLKGSMTLAALKVLDFTTSDGTVLLFLKALFSAMVLDCSSPAELAAVCTRLGGGADRMLLRDGIAVFLHQHVTGKSVATAGAARAASSWGAGKTAPSAAVCAERLKAARKALEAVTARAKDVEELM